MKVLGGISRPHPVRDHVVERGRFGLTFRSDPYVSTNHGSMNHALILKRSDPHRDIGCSHEHMRAG